jgi:hypothetical protein
VKIRAKTNCNVVINDINISVNASIKKYIYVPDDVWATSKEAKLVEGLLDIKKDNDVIDVVEKTEATNVVNAGNGMLAYNGEAPKAKHDDSIIIMDPNHEVPANAVVNTITGNAVVDAPVAEPVRETVKEPVKETVKETVKEEPVKTAKKEDMVVEAKEAPEQKNTKKTGRPKKNK